jgi:hypothetical protein
MTAQNSDRKPDHQPDHCLIIAPIIALTGA